MKQQGAKGKGGKERKGRDRGRTGQKGISSSAGCAGFAAQGVSLPRQVHHAVLGVSFLCLRVGLS